MYIVYLASFHLLWKGLLSDHALLHPQSFDLNLWLCTLIAWIDSSCLYPVEYIFKILLNTHVYIQVEQPIPPEVIFSIELRDHRHCSFPLTISWQKITPPPSPTSLILSVSSIVCSQSFILLANKKTLLQWSVLPKNVIESSNFSWKAWKCKLG